MIIAIIRWKMVKNDENNGIYVQLAHISPYLQIEVWKWTKSDQFAWYFSDLRPKCTHLPHICSELSEKWLKTPHYPPYMQKWVKNSQKMNKKWPKTVNLGWFWHILRNIWSKLTNICSKSNELWKHLHVTPLRP